MSIPHGTILGGLSTVPDLEEALRAYRDVLGLDLVEQGVLPAQIAQSWGCEKSAGLPYATLRSKSGAPCWFRFVQQPSHPGFKATTTYGWAAFELTIEDVWHWPENLPQDLFEIVGPPQVLENMQPVFIPMQALGPGREMIYLNEVLDNMGDIELPKAKAPVDKIFIVILATPDRDMSLNWYRDRMGLDRGPDFTLPNTLINNAFGLPGDTQSTISMVQNGPLPIVEVDDYPETTTARASHAGMLPPGNALVTLAVENIASLDLDWLTEPEVRSGPLYEGRRAACAVGSAGELIECVEVRP